MPAIGTKLAALLDCRVVLPTDRSYDLERRVWNVDIDRRPAAIVKCRSTADVATTVRACTDEGYEISVRSGGHNIAGTAVIDGAVMIDISEMNAVSVDLEAGTVTAEGGARLGHIDQATSPFGVVVPAGTVSHTGVAGLTLGGGNGYLSRLFGLTVDHVLEIEIVLADGSIVVASADERPDLFWALRGAGHNFGIATRFVYKATPFTKKAIVRQALFPASDRRRLLQFFRDWALHAPDEITTYPRLFEAPRQWSWVPPEHKGTPIISVATIQWADDHEDSSITDELFAQGNAFWAQERRLPHVQLQHACDDDFRYGQGHYWRAGMLNEFPDDAIDTVLHWTENYPGRALQAMSNVAPHFNCPYSIFPKGGQAARVDESLTSTGDRSSTSWLGIVAADWELPSEADPLKEWARNFGDAMLPWQDGSYVNFISERGDVDMARWVYGDKYDALVAIKRTYDPNNVFHQGLVELDRGGRS